MKSGTLMRICTQFEDKTIPVQVFMKNPTTAERINPKKDIKFVKHGIVVMVLNEEVGLNSRCFDENNKITDLSVEFVKVLYSDGIDNMEIWVWKDELQEIMDLKKSLLLL